MSQKVRALTLAVSLLALAGQTVAAQATEWELTGTSSATFEYYQGMTSSPNLSLFFSGPVYGLYRTNNKLVENARTSNVIPTDVYNTEGYNHVGDISYDSAEGGRILLPMECYSPLSDAPDHNPCQTGSIAVADPNTLTWKYYVKLDPSEIAKAMWVEASPDGKLIWTSSGDDLLAYNTSDITEANAAASGVKLKAAKRIVGGALPNKITGATFYENRLFLAGQNGDSFQVWSIDTDTEQKQLEIEQQIIGESEGLDTADTLDGLLHWQIQSLVTDGRTPTFPSGTATILSFSPKGQLSSELTAAATTHPAVGKSADNVQSTSSRKVTVYGTTAGELYGKITVKFVQRKNHRSLTVTKKVTAKQGEYITSFKLPKGAKLSKGRVVVSYPGSKAFKAKRIRAKIS